MVCIDGSFRDYAHSVEYYFEGDIRKLVRHYFETTQQMIEAGGIDIIGHIDKIYMNGQKYALFDPEQDWYRKPFEDCLDLARQHQLMIEINTKNLLKKDELYPRKNYLTHIHQLGIPVMVNSDCHYPDLVNDGRTQAFQLLKEAGFTTTRELVNGHWEDLPID